jgi:hypothetical protein
MVKHLKFLRRYSILDTKRYNYGPLSEKSAEIASYMPETFHPG